MKVTVFGTGYVGLVQGAVLADVGHDVMCVDIDQAKVAALQAGQVPIHEPGLQPMVQANQAAGRLRFTTDAVQGVAHGALIFLAVGTPPDEDGSADLQHVLAVARTIATHMAQPKIIVNKSTVPVGTADKVADTVRAVLAQRGADVAFEVVSNPEFLKEYQGALDAADVAVVFYSPGAVKIKKLDEISYEQIFKSFERDDLIIYTNPSDFKAFLFEQNLDNAALLLMSSGNYGGLNFDEVKTLIT